MSNFETERNDLIDTLIDQTMQPIDWADFQTLQTESPTIYRSAVATLGKILAIRITVRLDQRVASEADHANF